MLAVSSEAPEERDGVHNSAVYLPESVADKQLMHSRATYAILESLARGGAVLRAREPEQLVVVANVLCNPRCKIG